MPSPLAARRLEVHAAARADLAGFLRLDPARLRFSLGTSLADVSIPIEVSADAGGIVRAAAVELALVLASHHRRFVAGDDLDRLILREDYATLPPVPSTLATQMLPSRTKATISAAEPSASAAPAGAAHDNRSATTVSAIHPIRRPPGAPITARCAVIRLAIYRSAMAAMVVPSIPSRNG